MASRSFLDFPSFGPAPSFISLYLCSHASFAFWRRAGPPIFFTTVRIFLGLVEFSGRPSVAGSILLFFCSLVLSFPNGVFAAPPPQQRMGSVGSSGQYHQEYPSLIFPKTLRRPSRHSLTLPKLLFFSMQSKLNYVLLSRCFSLFMAATFFAQILFPCGFLVSDR